MRVRSRSSFTLSLGLRLIKLHDLDIWFDEAVLLFQVQMSYSEIWSFCTNENFPPLFPWILKAWNAVFPGEHLLRIFCALLGALTPPAAYFLGKELQDRRLGWLLGIACVFSVALLYYSQMIRMYTVLPFLACLSLLTFLRAVKTDQYKYWLLMALINLLGFYVFLFFIFFISGEFLALVWWRRQALKTLLRPVLTQLPALALMMIWVGVMLQRYSEVNEAFLNLNLAKEFFKLLGVFRDR